jgi:hypothetical protein
MVDYIHMGQVRRMMKGGGSPLTASQICFDILRAALEYQ